MEDETVNEDGTAWNGSKFWTYGPLVLCGIILAISVGAAIVNFLR